MLLTERELEKLVIYNMAAVAEKRKAKGLKLTFPEAVALITAAALEGAREGKSLEQVMASSQKVVGKKDVMDGVADMIPLIQVEGVFTDGSRLITVHDPIQPWRRHHSGQGLDRNQRWPSRYQNQSP